MIVVLTGHVTIEGSLGDGEAEMVLLGREGSDVEIHADGEARLLILAGEPFDDQIVGSGPIVMNNEAELRHAASAFTNVLFVISATCLKRPDPHPRLAAPLPCAGTQPPL